MAQTQMSDELIVNVCPTGMVPTRADNANLPLTPQEVAADVRRCVDAGASIVHIHPRDREGPIAAPERDPHDPQRRRQRHEEHDEGHNCVVGVIAPGSVVIQHANLLDRESKDQEDRRDGERAERSDAELPPARIADLELRSPLRIPHGST